jgi:hypothetical protein
MTALLLTACLSSAPTQCETHRLHFTGNAVQCALFGQQTLAEWAAAHPKWVVRRYRCGAEGIGA